LLGIGEDRLSIYLNDHLAGSTVGAKLARRAARNNRTNTYGPTLEAIAQEIAEDRDTLTRLMDQLGITHDRIKVALSWGLEQASRLKFSGELVGYSALSRLEELESLSLGVEGKLALWQALRATHGSDPRVATIDLEELIGRARSQRRRLERLRLRAAGEALLAGSTDPRG
jgi:hypothetical protein